MIRKSALLLAFLVCPLSAQAQGFYEPFDYATGALQTVSAGVWATANTGDDIVVNPGNLTVSGLQPPQGSLVDFSGAGLDYSRSLGALVNTGQVYYSFALRVNSMAGVTDPDSGYFMGFIQGNLATGNTFGGTVWARRVTDTSYNLGVEVRTAEGAAISYDTAVLNTGDTQFVVVSYDFVAGPSNDVAQLWVNPNSADFGAAVAPTPSVTDTHAGTDLTDVGRLFMRQDSVTETGNYTIDEIRTGSSWAVVTPAAVPEPTSLVVFGLAIGGVAARLWTRRRNQMLVKPQTEEE